MRGEHPPERHALAVKMGPSPHYAGSTLNDLRVYQRGGADFIHFPKAEKDSWVGLVLVWALSVAATLCVERIGQCL